MGSSDLDELKSALRSLVVSSPSQMDLRTLMRDYRELVGQPIPLSKFGYRNLRDFIQERCTDSFVINGPSHNPTVTLIVPDSLKHIDKFVRKQRLTGRDKIKGKRTSLNKPKKVENNNNINEKNTDKTVSNTVDDDDSDEIVDDKIGSENGTNSVYTSLQTRLSIYKKLQENECLNRPNAESQLCSEQSPNSSTSGSSKGSCLTKLQILNNLRKLQENTNTNKKKTELEIVKEDVIDPNDPLVGIKISEDSDVVRAGCWASTSVRGQMSRCLVLAVEGGVAKAWCPSERLLVRVSLSSLVVSRRVEVEECSSASQLEGCSARMTSSPSSRLDAFRSQLPQNERDGQSLVSMAHSLVRLRTQFSHKS